MRLFKSTILESFLQGIAMVKAAWQFGSHDQGWRHGVDWGGHVHPTFLRSVFIPKQK